MFIKKPVIKTALDDVIEDALRELKGYEAASEEYAQTVEQLTKLHAMQKEEKTDRLSKDTLALVLGNLAGVLVIVSYEHSHVMASKAMSLIRGMK
jgi:hypothetical protein